MSPGIPRGQTDGNTPVFRSNKQSPSRVRKASLQQLLNDAAKCEYAALDDDRHFTNVTCRFAPVFENARVPLHLVGKLGNPVFIATGRAFRVTQPERVGAYLFRQVPLPAGVTLDTVH